MSTTQYVPYQAYKSKRHSRVVSAASVEGSVNGSTSPQVRHTPSPSVEVVVRTNGSPKSMVNEGYISSQVPSSPTRGSSSPNGFVIKPRPISMLDSVPVRTPTPLEDKQNGDSRSIYNGVSLYPLSTPEEKTPAIPVPEVVVNDERAEPSSPSSIPTTPPKAASSPTPALSVSPSASSDNSSEAGPSSSASTSTSTNRPFNAPRKSSTFRVIRPPTSSGSTPRTSSPLRPTNTLGHGRPLSLVYAPSPLASPRQFDTGDASRPSSTSTGSVSFPSSSQPRFPSTSSFDSGAPRPSPLGTGNHQRSSSLAISPSVSHIIPPHRTTSLAQSSAPISIPETTPFPPSTAAPPSPETSTSSTPRVLSPAPLTTPSTSASTSASISGPSSAPSPKFRSAYRPGFQPKGHIGQRTDEFLELRARNRDQGRIERTRLERRFEKLVELHFSSSPPSATVEGKGKEKSAPQQIRRASSLFEIDFNDLRKKSASELWRGVLEGRAAAANGGKGDIRAAEQRITPWQDDSEATACPLCSASFHPLTNRKHHCRLCGRIVCSLPVKKPQRPTTCSLLFVSDPKTGKIEEVSEVVDYGVRPRSRVDSLSGPGGKGKGTGEEDKFLKGVRICRECKPVMLRQQYLQEARQTPLMVRLYKALLALELEIEEELPHFQELILQLNNNPDEAPAKEATAARKHLLQAFTDYDAIAKRIRKIPCPTGPGGSQDRVQAAIMARATNFLQKNMIPLQSLPKPKKRQTSPSDANGSASVSESQVIDPDSELAMALQPLLEQEALLESFIEEAKAHRKFEDVKTLKASLKEIRSEIDRIVVNAESGTSER